MPLPPSLYLGASSWTAPSWKGPFYPPELPAADYLTHYATRFRTVEVDSTWYRPPSAKTVESWRRKTPEGFVFALKVPRSITHEQVLVDCEAELEQFLAVVRPLDEKLGPLLFQFPYFKPAAVPHLHAFLARLQPFLHTLPDDVRFVVEIRNKAWLQPALFTALREARVALAWIDHPWMPAARQYARLSGARTADFLYVRLLGDRYAIEEQTTTWTDLVVDRTREIPAWADVLDGAPAVLPRAFVYHNNHYAGCSYRSAALFESAWAALENQQEA